MDINADKKIPSPNTQNLSVKNYIITDTNFVDEINELKDSLNTENLTEMSVQENTNKSTKSDDLLSSVASEFQLQNNFKIIKNTTKDISSEDQPTESPTSEVKMDGGIEVKQSVKDNVTQEEQKILKQVQDDREEHVVDNVTARDEAVQPSEVWMDRGIEVRQSVKDNVEQKEPEILKQVQDDREEHVVDNVTAVDEAVQPTDVWMDRGIEVRQSVKDNFEQEEPEILKQVQEEKLDRRENQRFSRDDNLDTAVDEAVQPTDVLMDIGIEVRQAVKDNVEQEEPKILKQVQEEKLDHPENQRFSRDDNHDTAVDEAVQPTDVWMDRGIEVKQTVKDNVEQEEPKILKQVQEEKLDRRENQRFSRDDNLDTAVDEAVQPTDVWMDIGIEVRQTVKDNVEQEEPEILKQFQDDSVKSEITLSKNIQPQNTIQHTDNIKKITSIIEQNTLNMNNCNKSDIPVAARNEAVQPTEGWMDRGIEVRQAVKDNFEQEEPEILKQVQEEKLDRRENQRYSRDDNHDTAVDEAVQPTEVWMDRGIEVRQAFKDNVEQAEPEILKKVKDSMADGEPKKEISENILQKEDNLHDEVNMTVKPADKRDEKEDNVSENNIINTQPIKEEIKPQVQTNLSFGTGQESFESVLTQNNEIKESDKELEEDLAILSTDEENLAMAASNNIPVNAIQNNSQEIIPQKLKLASGVDPISQLIADTNKQMQISRKILQKAETKTNFKPNNEITYSEVVTEVEEVISDNKPVAEVKKETHIEHKTVTKEKVVKVKPESIPQKDVNFMLSLTKTDSINLADTLLTQTQETAQNHNLSNKLIELIKKAMSENRPLRLDFDNKISVIIKISKEGKISADFIPGDKAVENYLRNNIPLLKQQFEIQNIKYDDLTHQNAKQQRDKEDNKNKKEQKNE